MELHRIVIENKVKAQSAGSGQLREEFLGVLQDLEDDENVAVTIVYLTPPGDARRFSAEYGALDARTLSWHRKAWLRWSGSADDRHHVVALLRALLRQEAEAEIAPVADYLRHTVKAFIRHIQESPAGGVGKLSDPRQSPELGSIVQVVTVQLGDVVYQLERYESTSVRVLNTAAQEYETAKPIFRRINQEKNLGVDLYRANGRSKNTRTLGREVIRALLEQNRTASSMTPS